MVIDLFPGPLIIADPALTGRRCNKLSVTTKLLLAQRSRSRWPSLVTWLGKPSPPGEEGETVGDLFKLVLQVSIEYILW